MDLISVIVPVYNVEKYIDKCVESIVNQTYKNLEIILVDDGSPDRCPQMCDDWVKKDARIQVIHKENGGLSSARNAGMRIMQGDYVCFVDGDDYIELNMIDILLRSIKKEDFDVCVCNVNHVDKNYCLINYTKNQRRVLCDDEIMKAFLNTNVFDSSSACDKLYKVSVIKENNLWFDETNKWGEDFPFNYLYFKCITKMISIEERLYNYLRERDGSITDGITYGKAVRWKNYKTILLSEKNNLAHYKIALVKYAQELMCCCRELLRSKNQRLVDECYPLIVSEIRDYYYCFMRLKELSRIVKYSILIIGIAPNIFKYMYIVYSRFAH